MKNNSSNIILKTLAFTALLVITFACNHKDLCYYHPHRAPVRVLVDWNGFDVTGITSYLFTKQEMSQHINTTTTSHRVDQIEFDVLEGEYCAAIFNKTPGEYRTIEFFDLPDYDNASVQVTEMTNKKILEKYSVKATDKFIADQPEWIARGLAPNIVVTKEMVERAEREYIEGGFRLDARTVTTVDEVEPDSLICKLSLRVKLQGIDSYHHATALVSGLAIGKQIISMKPLNETVSHYVDESSWRMDVESLQSGGTIGEIEGSLTCFGLPSDFKGAKGDVTLTIDILLADLKTWIKCEYPLEIGDLIEKVEGTNNLYMPIAILFPKVLPYVDPADGTDNDFNVDVEDWEREEVDILDH